LAWHSLLPASNRERREPRRRQRPSQPQRRQPRHTASPLAQRREMPRRQRVQLKRPRRHLARNLRRRHHKVRDSCTLLRVGRILGATSVRASHARELFLVVVVALDRAAPRNFNTARSIARRSILPGVFVTTPSPGSSVPPR
jgi:hypothetical protein